MAIINWISAILRQRIPCCRAVLYTVGCLATSLASIHWNACWIRPAVKNKNVFKHCQMSPGRQKSPPHWEPDLMDSLSITFYNSLSLSRLFFKTSSKVLHSPNYCMLENVPTWLNIKHWVTVSFIYNFVKITLMCIVYSLLIWF